MDIYIPTSGPNKNTERFRIETEKEQKTFSLAREYFQSGRLLFIKGFGRRETISKGSPFYNVLIGNCSISLEEWKLSQHYSALKQRGQYYDEKTFKIPEII